MWQMAVSIEAGTAEMAPLASRRCRSRWDRASFSSPPSRYNGIKVALSHGGRWRESGLKRCVTMASPSEMAQTCILSGVDQDPGEEVRQCLVTMEREHVRDVLVRADHDHAAGLAIYPSQL